MVTELSWDFLLRCKDGPGGETRTVVLYLFYKGTGDKFRGLAIGEGDRDINRGPSGGENPKFYQDQSVTKKGGEII